MYKKKRQVPLLFNDVQRHISRPTYIDSWSLKLTSITKLTGPGGDRNKTFRPHPQFCGVLRRCGVTGTWLWNLGFSVMNVARSVFLVVYSFVFGKDEY